MCILICLCCYTCIVTIMINVSESEMNVFCICQHFVCICYSAPNSLVPNSKWKNILVLSFIQECFNSPYGTGFFASYAERIPGESTQLLSEAAKENKVYLVGGRESYGCNDIPLLLLLFYILQSYIYVFLYLLFYIALMQVFS